MKSNIDEKLSRIKDFRPIDDIFFEVLAAKKEVCQEMLRTILEDDKLIVNEVIVQSSEKNIYGRSVRLDALCILGSGKKVNIEVQRSDNDNHFKRVRFNESVITARESNTGDKFDELIDLYVVYISEFDFIKGGKTKYHVDKVIRETGEIIDDGIKEVYVNTVVDDGSDTAALMSCFTKKMIDNPKFPELSNEVTRIKETEGGRESMCQIMNEYVREYEEKAWTAGKAEGIQQGMQKGIQQGSLMNMCALVTDGLIPLSVAAERFHMTEQEFIQVTSELAQ